MCCIHVKFLRKSFSSVLENGGLHDDHVGTLHACQVSVSVLRPAAFTRDPGCGSDGGASGRPPRSAAEGLRAGEVPPATLKLTNQ